ncbi:YDG domain-containing protein, partial [Azospirillum sp.]|uniref:YDG domain-containing protein n=1 Tax=Azospirillum sp. TaxID=34012 RepID=UPI00261A8490
KNVGTKTVNGLSLSGTDAGNYTLGSAAYTVTAKTLTASGNRAYDGTPAASGMTLSGLVGSDSVTGGGTLNDKNVGTKTVSGLSLSGTDAGNYTLGSAAYTVTAKTLTASGSKVYDGTTTASGMTLSGLVGSDSVTGGGTLNDKRVGTKTVSGLSLSGADAGNYILGSAAYTVTAKSLTWSVAGASATYGDSPTLGTAALNGLIGGDAVTATIAAFANGASFIPTVGTGAGSYSQQVVGLSGTDAGNYTIADSGNTAGRLVISPASLVVAADSANKTVGTVDPALSYRVSGLKGSDTSGVLSGNLSRAFGDTVGTYLIGQGTLSANSNYVIAFNGATFTVLPAAPAAGTTTATGTATTSPTVIAAVNALPVVVTPLSSNTGNVLGAGSATSSTNTSSVVNTTTSATVVNTATSTVGGRTSSDAPVVVDASFSAGAIGGASTGATVGRTVENSLSIGGVTVAFRQPSGFTGAGAGNAGGNATAEGGNNGGTLAFASSFTTFRADDSVQSAVDGGTAADGRRVGQ